MGERDRQLVIAYDLAGLARSDGYREVLRDVVLGADHDLDAAVEGGVCGVLGRGGQWDVLCLAADGEGKRKQAGHDACG